MQLRKSPLGAPRRDFLLSGARRGAIVAAASRAARMPGRESAPIRAQWVESGRDRSDGCCEGRF